MDQKIIYKTAAKEFIKWLDMISQFQTDVRLRFTNGGVYVATVDFTHTIAIITQFKNGDGNYDGYIDIDLLKLEKMLRENFGRKKPDGNVIIYNDGTFEFDTAGYKINISKRHKDYVDFTDGSRPDDIVNAVNVKAVDFYDTVDAFSKLSIEFITIISEPPDKMVFVGDSTYSHVSRKFVDRDRVKEARKDKFSTDNLKRIAKVTVDSKVEFIDLIITRQGYFRVDVNNKVYPTTFISAHVVI